MKKTQTISSKTTLPQYQLIIKKLAKERGFDSETIGQKFMLLLEESGEFAKAARKVSGISMSKESIPHGIEEEAADVFWVLIDICNNLGVDLEKAFAKKEKTNRKKKWS
jgi:NTP pyrophosphatase (non-canonical NTP hydrolase)